MRLVKSILISLLVIVVLGYALPAIFPTFIGTTTQISGNITGADAGSTLIRTGWPIVLVIIGLAIAVGVIIWAIKRVSIFSKGR